MKTKIVNKVNVDDVTIIEKELFDSGKYIDSYCIVVLPDGAEIGGYRNIQDALEHKNEWSE